MLLWCGVCADMNIFTTNTVWEWQGRREFRRMDLKFGTQVLRVRPSVQKHNSEIYRKYYCQCHKWCQTVPPNVVYKTHYSSSKSELRQIRFSFFLSMLFFWVLTLCGGRYHRTLLPRRPTSTYSQPWEPQISSRLFSVYLTFVNCVII
jgi:hypothetical protein